MEEKIKILMEESGCERAEAELALQITNYNLEKAISTLKTILKDIVVIKGKFIIETELLYGIFVLIVNKKEKNIIRMRCAVSYNPETYQVNLQTDWYSVEKQTHIYRLGEGGIIWFANLIEQNFIEQIKIKENIFYNAVLKIDKDTIQKILTQNQPVNFSKMQIYVEEINMEEFNTDYLKKNEALQTRNTTNIIPCLSDTSKLYLDVKLNEDTSGKMVSGLKEGDVVLTKISDTRDIAGYVIGLLGSKEQAYIPAKITAIEKNGPDYTIILHFTAGIYGRTEIPFNTKVKVIKSFNESSLKNVILTFFKKFAKRNSNED